MEAPLGRVQEWSFTTYNNDDEQDKIKKLRSALRNMAKEFKFGDHNLYYPKCNCESHQNYHAALQLLEEK